MDRPGIHDIPKARLRAKLRGMGFAVEDAGPLARFDFTLDGTLRVALRTAFPSSYRRQVRLRERVYSYVYRAWNFNFHHRGRIDERYCDFFVCVPLGRRKIDLSHAYVIPWEARTGKTFYLPDSQREYAGKYAAYRDAWSALAEASPIAAEFRSSAHAAKAERHGTPPSRKGRARRAPRRTDGERFP